MPELSNFLSHVDEFLSRLKIVAITFILSFAFFIFVGYRSANLFNIQMYYPYPDFLNSISIHAFLFIKAHLVPKQMILLNLGPFDTIIVDIYVALAMALVITIPILLYEIFMFISPALYKKEKRIFLYSIVPSTLLFVVGAVFAFYLLIPLLFKMVIIFALNLNVLPTMGVKNFITIVLFIMVGMGIIFETPMVIISLSYLKIVKPETWLKHWRYAIIGAFFLALLISPGASGGIMEITIATVIIVLYFAGALIAKKVYKD